MLNGWLSFAHHILHNARCVMATEIQINGQVVFRIHLLLRTSKTFEQTQIHYVYPAKFTKLTVVYFYLHRKACHTMCQLHFSNALQIVSLPPCVLQTTMSTMCKWLQNIQLSTNIICKQHIWKENEPSSSSYSTCVCNLLINNNLPSTTHPTCASGQKWKLIGHDQAVGALGVK